MTIYLHHERDRFYRDYGFRAPSDIPQYDKMLVTPGGLTAQPICVFSRLFNIGNISVLYGRANCGKTPLQYSMAWALASGCGLDGIHANGVESQSCLIVSGELNDSQWAKFDGWNKRIFPKRDSSAFVQIVNYQWKLDDENGQRYFEDLVRRANSNHPYQKPVSVVVFDNIKTLTTSGDTAAKWGKFFDFLNKLRDKHGWTIIVIHHTHKGKDDDSFGTYDIDIKVDNKIYLGRDFEKACNKVDGIERWLPNESDKHTIKDYFTFVREKTNEMLSGKYADSIWFYLALEKGRDFRASEKLPVFMRMLPEDEYPKWEAIDILSDESSWSYKGFKVAQQAIAKDDAASDASSYDAAGEVIDTDVLAEETKPTYERLLKSRDRELVLKWLRNAYAEGYTTRPQMAEWLGCQKHDIDNLMSNCYYKNITKNDLMP